MQRRTNLISRLVSGARAASSLRPLAPAYHDEMQNAHVLRRGLDARFYATDAMPQWLIAEGGLPQTPEEWVAVVAKNPSCLRFVPEDVLTQELCQMAVDRDMTALRFVPSHFQTYDIHFAVVSKFGYGLKGVPAEHKDYELCLAAIKSGADMDDVPREHQTQEAWVAAIQQSISNFKKMPDKYKTLDFCRDALIDNLENMQFVPAELQTREIWLIVVAGDPARLAGMPEQYQTQEMYQDLMSKNPRVIKFIPHEHQTKEMWLSALKFNVVELGDVPYLYRFAAYELLAAAKNLVVTDDPVFPVSDEAGLVAYTYAGKESRAEKTVCAEGGQLLSSLKLLTRKGASDINLVLIGHSALRSDKIAGMDARDIAALVVKFPIIKKVTLLGCLTVDVKKIDEEIALMKAHQAKGETTQAVCGLILLSTMPEENTYFELLSKAKLDRTFVVIKHTNQYSLLYLEKKSDGKIECQSRKLDEAAANEIHSCMTSGKKMAFPKHENEKYVLRSQQAPLSAAEFEVLEAVKVGAKRGTKAHPDYKTDKQSYPFLKSFSVSSWFDMNDSLMKRLAMTIEHTHGISRSIKIKGYPNPVYADVNEKRLIVTKDELYTYKRKFTLFADNLDRRKVEESRKDAMNRMKKAVVEGGATEAKSVVYETKPLLEEKKTSWFF